MTYYSPDSQRNCTRLWLLVWKTQRERERELGVWGGWEGFCLFKYQSESRPTFIVRDWQCCACAFKRGEEEKGLREECSESFSSKHHDSYKGSKLGLIPAGWWVYLNIEESSRSGPLTGSHSIVHLIVLLFSSPSHLSFCKSLKHTSYPSVCILFNDFEVHKGSLVHASPPQMVTFNRHHIELRPRHFQDAQ